METAIRRRDTTCVYCGVQLEDTVPSSCSQKSVGTWEHIINDASIISMENIARCCNSCNASKGSKELKTWLGSDYCKRKGITRASVAEVVRRNLQ